MPLISPPLDELLASPLLALTLLAVPSAVEPPVPPGPVPPVPTVVEAPPPLVVPSGVPLLVEGVSPSFASPQAQMPMLRRPRTIKFVETQRRIDRILISPVSALCRGFGA
ncbi:hypothetical protein [Sorangium sp. So ce854]|uniref:hypothetical protein n=1 Tax=Sorangium sp. So ce854 TaxID=3133322 RepID=UPI003F61F071